MTDNIVPLFPTHPVTQSDADIVAGDLSEALGMKVDMEIAGSATRVSILAPDLEALDLLCQKLLADQPEESPG